MEKDNVEVSMVDSKKGSSITLKVSTGNQNIKIQNG